MNDVTLPSDIVLALLGVGGATFIWTVVKSLIALRDSAESREDKAVARLEKFEANCREQLAYEREMGTYWSRVAGIYAHSLALAGIPDPPIPIRPDPLRPSQVYIEGRRPPTEPGPA